MKKIINLFISLMILTACRTIDPAPPAAIKQIKQTNIFLEKINENKQILVLYYDPYDLLDEINAMLQKKLLVDLYEIGVNDSLSLEKYDLILIGSVIQNNQVSIELKNFLSEYDFNGKDVSFYWFEDDDYEEYEKNICEYVKNANILSSFVLNNNEVSKPELVDPLLDGWLTSVYTPVNQ